MKDWIEYCKACGCSIEYDEDLEEFVCPACLEESLLD